MLNIAVVFKISDHIIFRPVSCDIVLDQRCLADTAHTRQIQNTTSLQALCDLPDLRVSAYKIGRYRRQNRNNVVLLVRQFHKRTEELCDLINGLKSVRCRRTNCVSEKPCEKCLHIGTLRKFLILTLAVLKRKSGKAPMLCFRGMSAKKKIKDDLTDGINIRRIADFSDRIRVQLFGCSPFSCVRKRRITAVLNIPDTVKVDKLYKLCDRIVGSVLQDKDVFGFQVKAEIARLVVVSHSFRYRFANSHILR